MLYLVKAVFSVGTLLFTFQVIFSSQDLYYYRYAKKTLVSDLPKITSLLMAQPYCAYIRKMSAFKNGISSNVK